MCGQSVASGRWVPAAFLACLLGLVGCNGTSAGGEDGGRDGSSSEDRPGGDGSGREDLAADEVAGPDGGGGDADRPDETGADAGDLPVDAPGDDGTDGPAADLAADASGDTVPPADSRDGPPADRPPVACTEDAECAPGGFCRETESGGGECHPYMPEGGSCGGFRPPFTQERCDPSLSCVEPNPLLADAPGICAIVVTVAELLDDPEAYDGHHVAIIEGEVQQGRLRCTLLACTPQNPCCNRCSGAEVFSDIGGSETVVLASEEGTAFSCSGTDCEVTCEHPEGAYRVIGVFRATTLQLDVESIAPTSFR